MTAGLAMLPYSGRNEEARLGYARRLAIGIDTVIVAFIDVFRNTSGQPLGGATGPEALSTRERLRWSRCRDLHWDLTTYATGSSALLVGLPDNLPLRQAAAALDSALSQLDATAECDNIASMMSAPQRWSPWQQQYETVARRFYRDWYGQLRTIHERDRAFARALNAVVPAANRIAVPPGLPANAPYAGAAVR